MRQARTQLKRNITSDIVEKDEVETFKHPRVNIFSEFSLESDDEEDQVDQRKEDHVVKRTEGINDDLDTPSHPLPLPLPPSLPRRRKAETTEANLRRNDSKGGVLDDKVSSTNQKVLLSPLELLLLSERKFLNFDAENRRKFGHTTAPPHSRSAKSYTFVTPEAHWSVTPTRISGGFSMTRSSESDKQFTFVISDEYNAIRDSYFAAESSGDPELVFEMAARVPFCTEALLQLFEYHRTVGNNEAAVSSLRQCIFFTRELFSP